MNRVLLSFLLLLMIMFFLDQFGVQLNLSSGYFGWSRAIFSVQFRHVDGGGLHWFND